MLKSSFLSLLGRNARTARDDTPAILPCDDAAPDSRRHPRVETSFAAVVHSADATVPVKVGNLSPGGAMIEASPVPQAGEPVHLLRGGLCAQGTVIWCSIGRCGIEFPAEIALDEWLAPATNSGQARIDEIVALMKSGNAAPQPEQPSRRVAQSGTSQLVEDLALVGALLSALKADLACSQLTLSRHGATLAHFEEAMQRLSDPGLPRRSRHQAADELGAVFQLLVDMEDEFTNSRETVARHGYKLQHLDLAMQMLGEMAADLVIGSSDHSSANPRLENLRIACDKALQPATKKPH